MRNLTKYNEDLSIPRKKDVEERSTATNLENGAGTGALKQASAAAASGANATAFGSGTSASAASAHAEGNGAVASGSASHAQNDGTKATGDYSHAEGSSTEASGQAAHAEGTGTIAANRSQHVEGEYNVQDPSGNEPSGRGTYQHIVGNGTSNSNRSNAHTMDWNGNAWYAGDVYVGSTSGTGMDNGSKKLATEDFVTADYLKKNGDSSETTTTFEQAAARENVASGDKLSVLFGKIAKWFSDLKTVAFSGKSSDLDNDAKFQTENDLNTALAAKQNKITASGLLKGDGAGGVSTAVPGTDYLTEAPVTSVNGKTGAVTVRELPAVTASDNGKSAAVVNGAWAAVDKTPFYVNCTISGYGVYDTNVTHDKTYAEIMAAYQGGRQCYAVVKLPDWGDSARRFILPLVEINTDSDPDNGMAKFAFSQIDTPDGPEIMDVQLIMIYSAAAEGIVTDRYLPGNTEILPEVTDTDNGKFLRVVDGAWEAVTISDANGGSF